MLDLPPLPIIYDLLEPEVPMVDDNDPLTKLEGKVRAIEALLLEMPEVTPERVNAAKERVRANEKFRTRSTRSAELLEKMSAPLDKHAETWLDNLAFSLKKRS